MPFKTPINSTLTRSQSRSLSKISSLKTFLSVKSKSDRNIPKDKQISSYDYLTLLSIALVGPDFLDSLLKTFFVEVFNPNNDTLENIVTKSAAKSLDTKGQTISSGMSNEEWIKNNASTPINKSELMKRTLDFTFGPLTGSDLDNAACSGKLFSLSNNPSSSDNNFEFNQIKLKERIKDGNVIFNISCQDVKIELPKDFEQKFGLDNPATFDPGTSFDALNNFVGAEVQRINEQDNSNSAKKSFNQIFTESVFNNMSNSLTPYITSMSNTITSNSSLNVSANDLSPSTCDVVDVCKSDPVEFEKRSAFSAFLLNALYALLISVILKALIKRVKDLIKKALAEKIRRRRDRAIEKQKQRLSFLDKDGKEQSKSNKFNSALGNLKDIFNFSN